jgi:hypothetical protein
MPIGVVEVNEVKKEATGKSRTSLIVAVVLIVALVVSNVWTYMALQTQVDDLQDTRAEYLDYVASHSYTDSEYESLNSTYNDYVDTHSHSDLEHKALEDERDAFKAPKLNLLNLKSSDEWSLDTPYLHFYGEVWNVGADWAYDCRIHVTAYQDAVKAIDSWFGLGTMPGENKKSLDKDISYEGVPLTAWNISVYWLDEARARGWNVTARWVDE